MGNANFDEVGGVGSDDGEAVRLDDGSDAAVLGTGTFECSRLCPKDLVGVVVVAQDGKPV